MLTSGPGQRLLGLRALLEWMPRRRRRQLMMLFGLMLAGAIAELLAIGAVLPFLRLIVSPEAVFASPFLTSARASFGWRAPDDLLLPAALLLVAAAVLAAGVRLLLAWASQRFVYRLGYDMDAALFRRIVRRPYALHLERNSSEAVAGFDKINALAVFMLLPVMTGVTSGVIALFIVALLFAIDPVTAAAATITMGVIYLGIGLWSRRLLARVSRRRAKLAGERMKAVQEGHGALRDIILDRTQPFHERRFAEINDEFRDLGARAAIVATAPRFVVEGVGVALIGLLAVYLGHRPGGVLVAMPVLGALALGAQRLMPLLQSSYQAVSQYLALRHSLADVLDLMTGPVLPPPAGLAAPDHSSAMFRHSIELAGTGFRYQDGTPALTGVNLVIARGDRVGLLGPTGSGKSTLVDLLMGLLVPTSGAVLLDGEPLTPDRTACWQARIAHVPQVIFLADDSVAANIAFSEAGVIDMVRVEEAARRAQVHDVVEALPQGYATPIGERGIRLSGGQRQRIGIARALYKRADVLIFDEATSALDDGTEAAVMAAIDALGRDLTIILIAHRLSTLRRCDVLYRLEAGRIVAVGDYGDVVDAASAEGVGR